MTLWGGRFSQQASAKFKAFNDSLAFDFQLAEQDIIGSIAWSNALLQVGVITDVEQQQIEVALNEIKRQILEHPQQVLESQAEDIHSWVESQLIDAIGSLGKKLHTGRSRNDQVATDLKLWCRQQGVSVLGALTALCEQLLACAKTQQDTILPGYTHLQRAQPVTFAHWCLAYVEMFERDHSRLRDTLKRLDSCPLGSGALAGTAYPIDRDKLAKQLGFARATRNSLDAVSDRDHVVELLSNASLSMLHLSRMAEDLIFYNSGEAGFIELSDTVTSGSSLMPQKKNPDVLELIRGKTGRVCGALQAMMMTVKALPLAYNKDLQEDKEGLFDAMTTWQQCLEMAALCFDGLTINQERTEQAALQGYANATELADYLVAKGIPFRDAHHLVGQLVREAIAQHCTLEALSLSALQKIAPQIEADVYAALDLKTLLAKRNVKGGVAPNQVAQALHCAEERITEYQHDKLKVRSARLTDLDTLDNMVSYWAKLGENLPRPRTEIVRDIGSFAVACDNERVTACGSLYVYGSGLAEIRSLGVDVGFQHQGHGKAIVKSLLKKARSMAIKQVFVLTRVPGFFMRQGFYETSKLNLPEKVMKDCEYCPKLHCCDEIAMMIDV